MGELNLLAEEIRKGREMDAEDIMLLLGCGINRARMLLNMLPKKFKDIEIVVKNRKKVAVCKDVKGKEKGN